MSTIKSLYGVTRTIPSTGEKGWGSETNGVLDDVCDGLDFTSALKSNIGVPATKNKGSTDTIAAGGTLTPTHPEHYVAGSGGAVTLSASNAIADGTTIGERLVVRGTSDTNTVTIPHNANTQLNGTVILGLGEAIELEWNGTDWEERCRSH